MNITQMMRGTVAIGSEVRGADGSVTGRIVEVEVDGIVMHAGGCVSSHVVAKARVGGKEVAEFSIGSISIDRHRARPETPVSTRSGGRRRINTEHGESVLRSLRAAEAFGGDAPELAEQTMAEVAADAVERLTERIMPYLTGERDAVGGTADPRRN